MSEKGASRRVMEVDVFIAVDVVETGAACALQVERSADTPVNPARSTGSAFHIFGCPRVQRICSRRHFSCLGSLSRHSLEMFYVVFLQVGAAGWSQLTGASRLFMARPSLITCSALMRSATRKAWAAMVRAGFTAAEDRKNE